MLRILTKYLTRSFVSLLFVAFVSTAIAADVEIKVLAKGSGEQVVIDDVVSVHYTGWLMDGKEFDSSLKREEPISFAIGAGRVIAGWEKGIMGMQVGEKRELIIPPELGYGKRGAGKVIPPNSTLRFEVELVSISKPPFTNIGNDKLKQLLAKGVKIYDIRRAEEWKSTGIVEGSKMLTFFYRGGKVNGDFIPTFTDDVAKDEEIIVICRTGNRTIAVANFLAKKVGYKKVYNVRDGITRWIKEGNPVIKP